MHSLLIVKLVLPAPASQGGLMGDVQFRRVAPSRVLGQPLVVLGRPLDFHYAQPFVPQADLAKTPMRGGVLGRRLECLPQEGLALRIVACQFFFHRSVHQARIRPAWRIWILLGFRRPTAANQQNGDCQGH